jgi:hypothetical protein
LNRSYAVVAGRLSVELFARGAQLAIGYLHADKPGRFSLAYDALELLRPIIDEKVFDYVGKARFRMGDFLVAPSGKYAGEVRVAPELLKAFAPATFVSNDDVRRRQIGLWRQLLRTRNCLELSINETRTWFELIHLLFQWLVNLKNNLN